jgi:hypothetical protein
MSSFVFNYYGATTFNGEIRANSTPLDNIPNNILVGTRTNDTFYGESGAGLYNEMHGLRGNDIFYGGMFGAVNYYVGGAGVDAAVIPAFSGAVTMSIDYQGGLVIQRQDGGRDEINSEVEIIQFSAGNKYFNINAGLDDDATLSTQFTWTPGDRLVVSNDWLLALSSGSVAINIRDVNRDGIQDTELLGINGVNSYALLNYNLLEHPKASVVGVYGEGILYDLA